MEWNAKFLNISRDDVAFFENPNLKTKSHRLFLIYFLEALYSF